ncbi:Lrp/AsnC family transcriptional regulator [Leucobacter sp. cx-42]|uniref:Lrp/AsnC family transcriptional regulator n=1 Tax=unclassified Leucobacter TaxID=2621730 RepID=UPI00165DF4B0|nr:MULTISPECIES: Lrp/AsnC family transcriptional regulator [unclassified Leucobacter]MBC9954220.1 Lrp/AsnC family transcriptional regulator [Leucobacter sp. cx-42]
MDELDRAIIEILEREGRLNNVDLAARIGLTPGPCLRRVQRLERDGIIRGYHAEVDPASVGRAFEVILLFELAAHDAATIESFERELSALPEVLELRRLFGSPDYFARVGVENLEAYEDFHTHRVSAVTGVARFTSHIAIKNVMTGRPGGPR